MSSSGQKADDPVVISDSDSESSAPPKKKATPAKTAPSSSKYKSSAVASSSKRKAYDDDDDDFSDDDDDDVQPAKKMAKKSPAAKAPAKKSPVKKAPVKKAPAKEVYDEDEDMTEQVEDKEAKKQKNADLRAMFARKAAGPAAPGSKEIPEGSPNCLAGLTIVFTGELDSISRPDATALAKRYGAKVTTAPSSKTTHVVIGEGAGQSKLAKLASLKAAQINEDQFYDLVRNRSSKDVDPATKKKLAEEEAKIRKAAKEMEKEVATSQASSSKSGGSKAALASGGAGAPKSSVNDPTALWTTKYAPRRVEDLIGNKAPMERLRTWLRAWPKSVECGFKKPGKDAMGTFRAVLISGPPGIGKTTAAHLAAELEGFTPIEFNASDTRSKKLIADALNDTINNTNLDAWLGKDSAKGSEDQIRVNKRTVLIMDEVDGMAGGDRGGVGAVNALIKKTKVPIICIANDAKSQKMKPFEHTTFHIRFQKPDLRHAKSRMLTIAYKEKLKVTPEIIEQLIQGAQNDIRLVLNMLSTWKLSSDSMTFDESREFGAANTKPGMHTPFSLYQELTAPGTWSATSKMTLNDKADLYFQDHSILPLMVHENYIKNYPTAVNHVSDKTKDFEAIKLLSKAARSISDGDLIDGMIHGWLGKNSAQGRLTRAAVELQAKMRLATSGSRFEIREMYAPYLFPLLSRPLIDNGNDGIEDVISVMDDYYLTTEDRETILELGVGKDRDWESLSKKIPSTTKSAFTRKYNASKHPIAFYKGDVAAAKMTAKPIGDDPDLEEAYKDDVVAEVSDVEMKSDDDDDDLSKNKLVKEKKVKGAAAAKKGVTGGAKAKGKPKTTATAKAKPKASGTSNSKSFF